MRSPIKNSKPCFNFYNLLMYLNLQYKFTNSPWFRFTVVLSLMKWSFDQGILPLTSGSGYRVILHLSIGLYKEGLKKLFLTRHKIRTPTSILTEQRVHITLMTSKIINYGFLNFEYGSLGRSLFTPIRW